MKAALFDVGDTLVFGWRDKRDRFAWLCEQAGLAVPADPALRRLAAQATERFFQARQTHPDRLSESWWVEHNEIGLSALGFPPGQGAAVYQASKAMPKSRWIDPEAPLLFRHLRERGYRIGLVSNWDGTLAAACAEWGFDHLVDVIGDSAVVGVSKPDPGIFRHVLDRLGVAPAAAFHVGDSWGADVEGAQAAGVTPVLYDPLGCEQRPAPHVIGRLEDLYDWVERWEVGQSRG